VTISGYLWLLLVWLYLENGRLREDRPRGIYLAPNANRINLIKFAQTAAANQLVMRRLNQNAEVAKCICRVKACWSYCLWVS